jgi:hypothetical protein
MYNISIYGNILNVYVYIVIVDMIYILIVWIYGMVIYILNGGLVYIWIGIYCVGIVWQVYIIVDIYIIGIYVRSGDGIFIGCDIYKL